MKTHKWEDVLKRSKLTEERKTKIAIEAAAESLQINLEMNLAQIREAAGLTQVQLAEKLEMVQSGVARIEKEGNDPMLSTLRRYVGALGGEVKVQAVINGKTVELVV